MISCACITRLVALVLLLAHAQMAYSAPQINWGDRLQETQEPKVRKTLDIDLRQHWESTIVGGVQIADEIALDPSLVWSWPGERFSSAPHYELFTLRKGERMVARWTVLNEKQANDILVTVQMPRLDLVHLSYRHDFGAWTTLTAGDRLAMNTWPLPDRQPSFEIPLAAGQLDLMVQVIHRGAVDAPVFMQTQGAFLESRFKSVFPTGVLVGVNLVLALMGLIMALHFRKTSFLSVTLMSSVVALVLFFGSGLGGLLIGRESAHFNDQAKFLINTSWGVLLPWVTAQALNIRVYSKPWWWGMVGISGLSAAVSWIWADYASRDTVSGISGVLLASLLAFTFTLLIWAWWKNYSRNFGVTFGILLYVGGLGVLFAAYKGHYSAQSGAIGAAVLSMLASFSIMRGLFFHHRMGRQVLARANISPLRDVLTGLLNRDGMQAQLYKAREQMREEQICGLFIYMPVMDANTALEELGEQGFESGMVQIAACLSTSVSTTASVGRVSRHAFGVGILMQPDVATATRSAQKILARIMALAASGTPLCHSARLSLAWLPLNSFRIDLLEQLCMKALEELEAGKRIAWVGGAHSYKESEQMMRAMTMNPSNPPTLAAGNAYVSTTGNESLNLYDRIHRIEREMLGVDSRFFEEEADRMSRALNEAQAAIDKLNAPLVAAVVRNDFMPTEQIQVRQKAWPG